MVEKEIEHDCLRDCKKRINYFFELYLNTLHNLNMKDELNMIEVTQNLHTLKASINHELEIIDKSLGFDFVETGVKYCEHSRCYECPVCDMNWKDSFDVCQNCGSIGIDLGCNECNLPLKNKGLYNASYKK